MFIIPFKRSRHFNKPIIDVPTQDIEYWLKDPGMSQMAQTNRDALQAELARRNGPPPRTYTEEEIKQIVESVLADITAQPAASAAEVALLYRWTRQLAAAFGAVVRPAGAQSADYQGREECKPVNTIL